MKKKGVDEFPFCVHLVSWEKENVSSEALEALLPLLANKYKGSCEGCLPPSCWGSSFLCPPHQQDAFMCWAYRLQSGMRGAFGMPQGTCDRVAIGQVLLSVRCKKSNSAHAQETIRRAKFKFPRWQKIIVSRKWGFTKFSRTDYMKWKQENRIMLDGVNARLLGCHGPLAKRQPGWLRNQYCCFSSFHSTYP